jgi:hypothetical protein
MMRGCASLKKWDYDFGKALVGEGVIDFLQNPEGLDGLAAIKSWVFLPRTSVKCRSMSSLERYLLTF